MRGPTRSSKQIAETSRQPGDNWRASATTIERRVGDIALRGRRAGSGSGFRLLIIRRSLTTRLSSMLDRRVAQITARARCASHAGFRRVQRESYSRTRLSSPFAGLRQSVKTITTADVKDYYRRTTSRTTRWLPSWGHRQDEIKAKVWETFGSGSVFPVRSAARTESPPPDFPAESQSACQKNRSTS